MRKVMRKFKVILKEGDWVKNRCHDVHIIASSKKLYWEISSEVSEVLTQNISRFCFQILESICYFKRVKAPKNPCQPCRLVGFADLTGYNICYYIRIVGNKPFQFN